MKSEYAGSTNDPNAHIPIAGSTDKPFVYATDKDVQLFDVFYGERVIKDVDILTGIQRALLEQKDDFYVSNETMRCDPNPGIIKYLQVNYCDGANQPRMRLSTQEGHKMLSSFRIMRVEYGQRYLDNHPEVIDRLNRALQNTYHYIMNPSTFAAEQVAMRGIDINNENMGGDPMSGQKKFAGILVLTTPDREERFSLEAQEGDSFPDMRRLWRRLDA